MSEINRREALGLGVAALAGSLVSASAFAGAQLPDNVSKGDYESALKAWRSIVGEEWVFADTATLQPYMKKFIPDPFNRCVPMGAVAPQSLEEVQAIVKVAGKYGIPLWPVSTGKNMGYGQASPATPGQVILDLKRMNRILEVNVELGTALLEPGVTYQQLKDYLVENDIPLWIDVPTVGPIASPVGNTLDRGVGYTPYGEHFMFQCGMEVVLADGDVLRTGMGSLPNQKTWTAFKWGYGPYLDGMFTQSNFGIVTKMGLWLMPKPPVYKPFVVQFPKVSDIDRMIEALRPLRVSSLIPNCVLMMGAAYQLAMFKRRDEIYDGPGDIPDEHLERVAAENGLGAWNSYFALYGTQDSVAAIEQVVRPVLTAAGGNVYSEEEMHDNPWFHHHQQLMQGGLNLDEVGLTRWRGNGGGLAWFAPVGPVTGDDAREQAALATAILSKYGLDYTAAWAIGWRDLHHICALLYDRSDEQMHRRADECYRELVNEFGKRGWGVYRVGTAHMELAAQQFGEKNREVNQTLKRALDPKGIIAPGKSGIYN